MNIDGLEILNTDEYCLCYVNNLSDPLKEMLRSELRQICHGRISVEEGLMAHSYKSTLTAFLDRYSGKESTTKMGIIAELLAHLLINKIRQNMEPITIHFNKEERSIRKGFDLVFVDPSQGEIWYGEVKSGELSGTPDAKNRALLVDAKNGLSTLLSGERPNIWESVLIDTNLTIPTELRLSVKKLLDSDLTEITSSTETRKNAILISVLFHDVGNKISQDSSKQFYESIVEESLFQKTILFSIQKTTYSSIEDFLQAEVLSS